LYQNQSPRINWWSYHPTDFDRIIFFLLPWKNKTLLLAETPYEFGLNMQW
jgi:hypothetical protein